MNKHDLAQGGQRIGMIKAQEVQMRHKAVVAAHRKAIANTTIGVVSKQLGKGLTAGLNLSHAEAKLFKLGRKLGEQAGKIALPTAQPEASSIQ